MKPELSIIITSFKNPPLLELCLNSLKESVQGIDYEIIVADTCTQQDTIDLMRESFPDIKFFANKRNTGFGYLVNQGLAAAQGNFLFVINADIIIKDKQTVSEMINYLKSNPQVGVVGPRLINFDNSVQPSCFRFYQPMTIIYRRTFLNRFSFAQKHLNHFLMEDVVKTSQPVETDWLMGSCLMTKRSVFEEVGPLDTQRFWMYFEDVDWCWRVWEKGYKVIYYPKVSAYHYHGKQSGSQNAVKAVLFNKYTRMHIMSAIKFFLKHSGKENPHRQNQSNS